MLKRAAARIAWIGRAASTVFGLALVLALIVGAASTALGANGKPFLLAKTNVATAVSKLVKQGPGPALELRVAGPGQPPLRVNSPAKVANLNADRLDKKDSSAFLPSAIYQVDEAPTVGPNTTAGSIVQCDEPGDLAIGGGFSGLESNSQVVASSRVSVSENSWRVSVRNTSTTVSDTITTQAVCADFPPLRP